ncbi:hypothetical protein A2671_02480 [Candidatus Kaiserbacteria bacterium RIFCSPHIGHO2_01_FULL_49_13]|uniref:Uncharacterized protein n=1 Tax=Candidatus Kaiserbacteria bacterium RIFCSPHIGHO2_01_FULL_49_13 TaxID=1798477 RepID=A0A1F6CD99_9BACT|nr:MAG: hypothetical protein A2671_02480 [Candidatus Kaiserbacteria bacterium RIFCSPHIGHO2_01_FULL_49_13]
MPDISCLPAHVQEAIRKMDLLSFNLKRAQAGAKWLDLHAPADWRLQMISIHDGHVIPQVRLCWGDQTPLALAFRREEEFAGSDGRVLCGDVSQKFFPGETGRREERRLGFHEQQHFAPDHVVIDEMTDTHFLDEAWALVLKNFEWHAQPVRKRPMRPSPVTRRNPLQRLLGSRAA